MDCYKDFIGIRSQRADQSPNPLPCKSNLFIEDLAGFSLKRVADFADYESAYDLIKRKAEWACKVVTDDVLNNIGYLQTNNLINMRVASPFLDIYNDYFIGERGFKVKKYFWERQTLSTFRITKIYIKCNDTIENKVIKLIDGDKVTEFIVDLVAGETITIYPTDEINNTDYIVVNNDFSIVMDNFDVQTCQSRTAIQDCGCSSSVWKQDNQKNYYIQGEEFGITCDFTYFCDLNAVSCLLLQQLRYAVLYKTGILVLNECLATDRLNFFSINSQEWALKEIENLSNLYNEEVRRSMRNIVNVIRSVDVNCWECKTNSMVELIS